MTPEQMAALVSIPSAVAVIVTVGIFLRHDADQRDKDRAAQAAARAEAADQKRQDRLVWENHLSQSIRVQAETANVIGDLVTAVKVMQTENNSSLVWARDAMQSLIREVGRSQPVKHDDQ